MTELAKYSEDNKRLCLRHKVKRLYAFGSVLTENYNKSSGIDFIVDFEPIDIAYYVDNYYDFKFSLEAVFHKPLIY